MIEVNLNNLKKIKSIITDTKNKSSDEFITIIKNESNKLNKSSDFYDFFITMSNKNTSRISNMYDNIKNKIISEKIDCKVNIDNVTSNGIITDVNIHKNEITATYNNNNIIVNINNLHIIKPHKKQKGGNINKHDNDNIETENSNDNVICE